MATQQPLSPAQTHPSTKIQQIFKRSFLTITTVRAERAGRHSDFVAETCQSEVSRNQVFAAEASMVVEELCGAAGPRSSSCRYWFAGSQFQPKRNRRLAVPRKLARDTRSKARLIRPLSTKAS